MKKIVFASLCLVSLAFCNSCDYEQHHNNIQGRGVPLVGVLIGLGWTYSSYLNAPGLNDSLYTGGPSRLGKCVSCHNQP